MSDLESKVNVHHKVLFGDPENMKEMPGIVSEQMRTNEILSELRAVVMRINWLLITGFLMALGSLVIKGFSHS